MTKNLIENQIELSTPLSRVWQALSDSREFGTWFGVKLEKPFEIGKSAKGFITHPGYEHIQWKAVIQKMDPEKLFSFTWNPYAIDPQKDYSKENPTLVEFKLEKTKNGSLLTLTESGFDKIPEERHEEAFRMHVQGWAEQMKNIANYLKDT